jgi:hypothetical protein
MYHKITHQLFLFFFEKSNNVKQKINYNIGFNVFGIVTVFFVVVV